VRLVSAVVVLHDLEDNAPALACPVQKGPAAADVGGGHLDLADQAEGVDQQVALAALKPLGAVVAGWPPVGGLDTLAIQDGRAGWAAGLAWCAPCLWKPNGSDRIWPFAGGPVERSRESVAHTGIVVVSSVAGFGGLGLPAPRLSRSRPTE
jgi:hypothetical protein